MTDIPAGKLAKIADLLIASKPVADCRTSWIQTKSLLPGLYRRFDHSLVDFHWSAVRNSAARKCVASCSVAE